MVEYKKDLLKIFTVTVKGGVGFEMVGERV